MEPKPSLPVLGLDDMKEYQNKINPDIIATKFDPGVLNEAVGQVARWKFNPTELHTHPAVYTQFMADFAGLSYSEPGEGPIVSLGGKTKARIMGLVPHVHVQMPETHIYVVAECPGILKDILGLTDEERSRMVQRIVLSAPIDVRSRLVSFFYQLLRDTVQPGEFEQALQADEAHMWNKVADGQGRVADAKVEFSNPYLAQHALDAANRILGVGESKIRNRQIERLDKKSE